MQRTDVCCYRGTTMARELLVWAVTFIAIGVATMIGGGLIEQTKATVGAAVGETQLVNDTYDNSGDTITTFTSYLPILGLAVVGGLALFYVVRSLGMIGGSD